MLLIIDKLHLFTTFALFGLIWTIQLVHYPAFFYVDSRRFVEFSQMHTTKITLFVMPLMLIEMLTSILGCLLIKDNIWYAYLVLNLINWSVTFFISVPCHNKLAMNKDEDVIKKLVNTNWFRTIIWTIKTVLILWIII